jgi:hypothetical protein
MRGRWGLDLLVAAVVACAGAPRAASAAEADPAEPSVCAPPCADGESCVGGRCIAPDGRASSPAAAEPPPAQPKPPASATFLGDPQAAAGRTAPGPAPAPTSAPAYPPPPSPSPQPGPAPPPGATYQPPGGVYGQPPSRAYRKRRFLTLPYLGVHSYQNQEASAYDPGARLGVLLGGRVGEVASLNGELSVNRSNVHGLPSTTRFEETNVVFAFSPLFHLPAGAVELALGPKLGIFVIERSVSDTGASLHLNVDGYALGANLGFFIPVSPLTSLGVLVSYDLLFADQACQTVASAAETCGSASDSNSFRVLGLTAAALF